MRAGLQAPLAVPMLSIKGWLRPGVMVLAPVSVTGSYKDLSES